MIVTQPCIFLRFPSPSLRLDFKPNLVREGISAANGLSYGHLSIEYDRGYSGAGFGLAAVGLVFEYLHLLKSQGPQEWAFKEMSAVAEMKFRYAMFKGRQSMNSYAMVEQSC